MLALLAIVTLRVSSFSLGIVQASLASPLTRASVHVLLAVVRLQALHLLPVFLAVQHPAQSAQKADDGQYNGR